MSQHNRHGLPVLTSLAPLKWAVPTFKGHSPWPRVIESKAAITCDRLKTMERELAKGGAQ